MADMESSFVTSSEGLASLYAPPAERIVKATLDHVNSVGRAFIAASPFLVIATGSQNGFDCSPKGDHPGFVQVSEDGQRYLSRIGAAIIRLMASRTSLRTRRLD
jgi:predicted pyridoxine 5'-phosphate oxidase superfamily flavin-nucleotide-binding protein